MSVITHLCRVQSFLDAVLDGEPWSSNEAERAAMALRAARALVKRQETRMRKIAEHQAATAEALQNLVLAAHDVLDKWEEGDLGEAVRELAACTAEATAALRRKA